MKPKVFAYYWNKNGRTLLKSNIFRKFTEVELTFSNGALQVKEINPNQLNLLKQVHPIDKFLRKEYNGSR